MNNNTKNIPSTQDEYDADEYAMELERKAAELEITCDYYIMEFL